MGRTPNANHAYLLRCYVHERISVEEALEVLRIKGLSEGCNYFFTKRDSGLVEVVRGEPWDDDQVLPAEEVEAYLEEKGLYIHCGRSNFLTIRKIPPDADKLLPIFD